MKTGDVVSIIMIKSSDSSDRLPLSSVATAEMIRSPSESEADEGITNDQAPVVLADVEPTVRPSTKISTDESGSACPVIRGEVIEVKLSKLENPESKRLVRSRASGAADA